MAQASRAPGTAAASVAETERDSAEQLLMEAEPWEAWETTLIGYSIGLGIVGLVILDRYSSNGL